MLDRRKTVEVAALGLRVVVDTYNVMLGRVRREDHYEYKVRLYIKTLSQKTRTVLPWAAHNTEMAPVQRR